MKTLPYIFHVAGRLRQSMQNNSVSSRLLDKFGKARRYEHRVRPVVNTLPWRVIGFTLLLAIFMSWSMVHFYLARPARIIKKLENTTGQLQELDKQIETTKKVLRQPSTKQPDGAENSLSELSEQAKRTDNSLPAKPLFYYAFMGKDDSFKAHADKLYSEDGTVPAASVAEICTRYTKALQFVDELLKQPGIDKDTAGLIRKLTETRKELEALDKGGSQHLEIVIRLLSFSQEAATTYEQNKDIGMFNARYENLSSELYKEVVNAWEKALAEPRQKLDSQRTEQTAILSAVKAGR